MRDPARIDRILEKLRAVWQRYPDQRFGQLVHNALGDLVFHVEDEITEAQLDVIALHGWEGLIGKIGARIRQARSDSNLSMGEASRWLGIGLVLLSNIELGRFPPTLLQLEHFARCYGVTTDWLLRGT